MKHISKSLFYRCVAVILSVCAMATVLSGCSAADTAFLFSKIPYTKESSADDQTWSLLETQEGYNTSSGLAGFLTQNQLCFNETEVVPEGAVSLYSGGLFDVNNQKVLYAKNIHEKRTPASITKILTAYVVLKYAQLDDIMTASKNVLITESGAKLCGFLPGDKVSVRDGLFGLLVYSGNDVGVMLAEHVSGNVQAFCDLMNLEAKLLGATNTHFLNPHGLTVENHYTTAYDLYLIFNALIKNELFMEIIQTVKYECTYTKANGQVAPMVWVNSNRYLSGAIVQENGVTVLGGKTGYTMAAGGCLIVLTHDVEKNPYIAIVLNAADKNGIYQQMSALLMEISK